MFRRIALSAVATVAMVGGAAAQELLAERGAYLVNGIGACNNCHTPRLAGGGGNDYAKRLSGSTQTFQTPQYTVKGSNLTPSRANGLGAWTDDQIKIAVAQG